MNFNNFGQTADYADTMGYNRQGNPPKQKMFPGYNEEFDTTGLESNLSEAELQKQKDEDFQNMINNTTVNFGNHSQKTGVIKTFMFLGSTVIPRWIVLSC